MPDREPHQPNVTYPSPSFFGSTLERKVDAVFQALILIYAKVNKMALDLSDLQASVDASAAGEASAIALLNGLAAKIDALVQASGNTVDPAALQAISDAIKSNTAGLAAAVTTDARP